MWQRWNIPGQVVFLWVFSLWFAHFPQAMQAGDWPQILGPNRNGIAVDEKLVDQWPRNGPPERWEKRVGSGTAGLAVVGNRAVLFHRIVDEEVIECLDVQTGRTLYQDRSFTSFVPQVGSENGPRCVPVISGNSVVTFGAQGLLTCLDFQTGKRLWQRQTHRDFRAPEGHAGAGSSPIVVNDRVIVNVGGSKQNAGIVAFSLETGETVWQQTNEPASDSAPVAVDVNGMTMVMMLTRYRCQLVDPDSGVIPFQFPFGKPGPAIHGALPLIMEDRILVTSYSGGGSLYGKFDLLTFELIYSGKGPIATQYCTPIYKDGFVYVIDGRQDLPPADLKCVDLSQLRSRFRSVDEPAGPPRFSEPVKWVEQNFGYGTLLLADDKLIAAKNNGELLLIEPSPDGLKVLSKCRPFNRSVRALPALSNGNLLIRDQRTLKCLVIGE